MTLVVRSVGGDSNLEVYAKNVAIGITGERNVQYTVAVRELDDHTLIEIKKGEVLLYMDSIAFPEEMP